MNQTVRAALDWDVPQRVERWVLMTIFFALGMGYYMTMGASLFGLGFFRSFFYVGLPGIIAGLAIFITYVVEEFSIWLYLNGVGGYRIAKAAMLGLVIPILVHALVFGGWLAPLYFVSSMFLTIMTTAITFFGILSVVMLFTVAVAFVMLGIFFLVLLRA